jgi:hypothetical protein
MRFAIFLNRFDSRPRFFPFGIDYGWMHKHRPTGAFGG